MESSSRGADWWTDTKLWSRARELTADDDPLRELLVAKVEEAAQILRAGGTAPLDFTLHDPRHAFQVAERMPTLIEPEVFSALSRFEVALLLAAAYAHDIGMAPRQGLVNGVLAYVFALEEEPLLEAGGDGELEALRLWVAERHAEVSLPLNTRPDSDSLARAQELVAEYVRHRHGDWSVAWIEAAFADRRLDGYVGFAEDLSLLCVSHVEGLEELLEDRFDPRLTPDDEVVHLRFLAALLRMADVLDVDPERTPSVIFRHRDVSSGSVLFWHKDHEMTVRVPDDEVVVHARPTRARIHRAIEETADDIDAELSMCRRLDEQEPFAYASWTSDPLPHRWRLKSRLRRDIAARPGTYEYIDGAFRVDTRRVLELLGGTALYSTRLAAVRELIQNALDAVREQIAWQQLETGMSQDVLAATHMVDLRLETSASGTYLICSDTGVGMTRAIIEDGLLVSGRGRRREVLELEQRCAAAHIPLERTGRFGIGVLSYFMLAGRVGITTTRSSESRPGETTGWRFEVDGLDGFGELTRDTTRVRGTEVRLQLLPEQSEDCGAFFRNLRHAVGQWLVFVPCKVRLTTTLAGEEVFEVGPGWGLSADEIRTYLADTSSSLFEYESTVPDDLLPQRDREAASREQASTAEWNEAVAASMRFEVIEGELRDGLGRYRAHVPWFDLAGDLALGYLMFSGGERPRVRSDRAGQFVFEPESTGRRSWRGIAVVDDTAESGPAFIEVDWTGEAAGTLQASRDRFDLSRDARDAEKELHEAIRRCRDDLAAAHSRSRFASLNLSVTDAPCDVSPNYHWLSARHTRAEGAENERAWCPIRFPALPRSELDVVGEGTWMYRSSPVSVLDDLGAVDYFGATRQWTSASLVPDRVVIVQGLAAHSLAPLWQTVPDALVRRRFLSAPFPPGGERILGLLRGGGPPDRRTYWNASCPAVAHMTDADWAWFADTFMSEEVPAFDPRPHQGAVLGDAGRATTWLLQCVQAGESQLFNGLSERFQEFLTELWRLVGLGKEEVAFVRAPEQQIDVVGLAGWRTESFRDALQEILPSADVVGDEWVIHSTP